MNDPLFDQAIEVISKRETASVSYIQRKLMIGYNRSARLVEALEEKGFLSRVDGLAGWKVNTEKLFSKQPEEDKKPKKITDEEWESIENCLSGYIGSVKFKLRGHDVSAQLRKEGNKIYPTVYIDGCIKGIWIGREPKEKPEVLEEVWRKRTMRAFSPSEQKRIIKKFGKRDAKKHFPNLEKVIEYYDPRFLTPKSLVNKYKKIKGLELVSINVGF